MKVIMTEDEIIGVLKTLSNRSLIDLLGLINCQATQWGIVSRQEARLARAVKNMDLKTLAATKEVITSEMSARDKMAANLGQGKQAVPAPIDEDPAPPPPSRRVAQPPPRRLSQPQDSCPPTQTQFTSEDRAMLRTVCERLGKVEIRRRPPPPDCDPDFPPPPPRRSSIKK
jgi:hypothetical protein